MSDVVSPATHGLRAFIEQAVASLGNVPSDTHEGLIFAGEVHDTHPRALLLDPALQPTDINLYLVLKTESDPRQGRPFPSYTDIQRSYRLARGTVAKAIAVLRLTRWITVLSRVRGADGRVKGNIYVVHSSPLTLSDTLYLDESYLDFIARSISHANAQVARVARALHHQFTSAEPHASNLEPRSTLDTLAANVATHASPTTVLGASVFAVPRDDTSSQPDSVQKLNSDPSGLVQNMNSGRFGLVQFLNSGHSGLVQYLNLVLRRLFKNIDHVKNQQLSYSVQNLNSRVRTWARTHAHGSSCSSIYININTTTTTTTYRKSLNTSPTCVGAREEVRGSVPVHGVDTAQGSAPVHGVDTPQGSAPVHGVDTAQGSAPVHGVDTSQGSVPVHGVDTSQGSEPVHGVDTSQGSEPVHGVDTSQGSEPVHGVDTSQGSVPVHGVDTPQGSAPVHGVDTAQGSVPVHGVDTSQGSVPVHGVDTSQGSEPVHGVDTSQGSVPVHGVDTPQGSAPVHGVDTAQGSAPVHGVDTAQGSAPVHGVDTAQGSAPVRGVDTTQGSAPVRGVDTSQGSVPVRGADTAQGSVPVRGVDTAQGSVPVRGADTSQGSVPVHGVDTSQGLAAVHTVDTSQGSVPALIIPDNTAPNERPFIHHLLSDVPAELRQYILFEWAGMRRTKSVRNPLGLLASFCRAPERVAFTECARSEADRYGISSDSTAHDEAPVHGVDTSQGSVPHETERLWTPRPELIDHLSANTPDSLIVYVKTLRALVNKHAALRFVVPNEHVEQRLREWDGFTSSMARLLSDFKLSNYTFHVGS